MISQMTKNQEKVLRVAQSLIGTKYKYVVKWKKIPTRKPKYISCSSFSQFVIFNATGILLEWSTILQAARNGKRVKSWKNLKVGDLIFFRGNKGHYDDALFPNEKNKIYIGHVAVYSGNNKAIHAAGGKGVVEETLTEIIKERGTVVIIKRIL